MTARPTAVTPTPLELMARRPCIEPGCTLLSQPGAPRCRGHQRARGHAKNRRRRTLAPPGGAAAQARAALNRAGHGTCAHCRTPHPAHHLEVDHIQALADRGTDTPDNIQLLCLSCHRTKTTNETAARRAADRAAH